MTTRTPSSGTPSAYFTATAAVALIVSLLLVVGGGAHVPEGATVPVSPDVAAAAGTVLVHVGVILDLETALGKKGLLSVEMALEDFYAAHPNFTTRVELHVRDSNRDVVNAAFAAVDLIRNEKVSVVIGPQSALQAEFVTYLANKTKVPAVSFSATRDAVAQYHIPYFLRACVDDSFQAASIAAFIQAYSWKNVVVVYEDNNFGVGILPSITDALQDVEAHVIYRSAIPTYSHDYLIDEELYKLMTMQTRVFIVHMLPACGSRFFARAAAAGMMTEGYVWIVTDNVGVVLDVLPEQTIEIMQGVIGFRPYVAKSARIVDFMTRFVAIFRAKYHQDHDKDVRMTRPTVLQYWAYDVAWAVATAAENAKRVRFPNLDFQTPECVGKNSVDDLRASPAGPELLRFILDSDFDGLAGRFRFVDRHIQPTFYEVVNVIGEKARGIGFWSPRSGLSRLMNSSASPRSGLSRAGEVLKPVIWPGDSTTVPKGWDFPVNAKILRIGVPVRHDFKFFVNVNTDPDTNISSVSGYSIDVFEAAVKRLPYALRYEYIPVDCANSYNDLVSKVYFKKLDAAVGDVTIVANRTRYVDFTMPYTESGVSMLVLTKNDDKRNMWIFLKPLKTDLWIAIGLFIIFTGLVVWLIEHPKNDEFQGSTLRQFSTVFYFTFSTLTFSHDQIIKSLQSKVLVVIWCFVVLVLAQCYTASLSSLLTAQRLQPSVTDPRQLLGNGDYVGYQNGSFVLARLLKRQFDERKIKVLSTLEEYAKALRAGSKHGGVSAIFDEIPYLNAFITQYGKEFQIVSPPVDRTDGFGFAFPIGSPLVPDLSKAILSLREGHEGSEIENKWFRDATPSLHYGSPDSDSARLSLRSFKGLFVGNGFVLGIMLLINLPKFILARYTQRRNTSPQRANSSGKIASDNAPEQLQDGMATDPMPTKSLQVETVGDNAPEQLQNGMATDLVSAKSLPVETKTS
ncbi:LOW QUALITY PROTEIN: glutamate receptor 2.3-like [Phragmites australis]|uniref:LOW QUALITY PROTEIN: glutamate receptor 2.3-like n=1 Tax=Phragmites australis TaxID=29695 RepID=UPI002D770BE4|nr:LOW QUALITY PROTEIN: glutamate receptor 2.3-like [Phragmites australis]